MAQVQSLTLPDGNKIPMLGYGLGTARAKSRGSESSLDQDLVNTVLTAIRTGYDHLDGAESYRNEPELGEAIKQSGLHREKFYLTTKISAKPDKDTVKTFEQALKNLQVEYVDLFLIHDPFFATSPEDLQAKWKDMETIHASGKAKSIGVSNFRQTDLEIILKTAKVVPAINQIEYHPYLQHGDLIDFHRKHDIALSAYAPLTAVVKAAPGPLDGLYEKLAQKYAVTPGEIALRWVLDQGIVALTTSGSEDRLKQYLKVANFKLTSDEIEEISKLGEKKHYRGFWKKIFAEDDRT